jgi:beta-lactamase regulating signal transducer with metallopeptidase domain
VQSLLCLALSNALVATLLAVLVAVVAPFCRRPIVRHALWLLVLLKLITPPLLPLSISWPRTEVSAVVPEESPPTAIVIPSRAEAREPITTPAAADEPNPEAEAAPTVVSLTLADMWMPLVMAVWLSGSLIWWTLAAVRLRKFRRLLRQARLASAEVQEQARRLATLLRLRRCPPVAFVSVPLSPLLWALGFSPRLLVPAELWQKLGAEQQDTLLAHELAHLRRGDHWVRRLEIVVLGLYWWHPVVWWARRRLQEAEEECCDALVLTVLPDAAPAYASALVETVAFLSQTRAAALVGASGAGQVPLLKRRLTMILTMNPARRSSRAVFWIVLGLGALLLPLAPGAARTETPQEPQSEEANGTVGDAGRPFGTAHGKPLADEMRRCAACHQPVPVPDHGFQDKPLSWREAHAEAIRLMDEVNRRQAQLREAAKRLPAAAEPDRSEQIEKLQDEIELLKVQVQVKQAHLEAAKTEVSAAETIRRISDSNTVPESVRAKAKTDVIAQKAQVRIWEAELQEPLIRLKQAERRLARLQRPAERSTQQSAKTFHADLGWVKRGTLLKHRVSMINSRGSQLRIAHILSSSGALTAHAEKREIPRGEPFAILVEIDTRRFIGHKRFTITVQFEEGQPEACWQFDVTSVDALPSPSTGASGQDKQTQLKELEGKIERLQTEIRDLRREMEPKKPGIPGSSRDGGKP